MISNSSMKDQKVFFSSQIRKPKALTIPCRRREMKGIKDIKFFALILSLYRESHMYTKILSVKVMNFGNLMIPLITRLRNSLLSHNLLNFIPPN